MTKYREILRLTSLGLSQQSIADWIFLGHFYVPPSMNSAYAVIPL